MSGAGLAAFASLLLPVEGGAWLAAGADWSLAPDPPAEADVVVWGGAARDVAGAPAAAGAGALRREAAIARLRTRPPRGWRVVAVHRLPPAATRRDRVGRMVRSALGGGALVELRRTGAPARPRRIDEVLGAVGARGPVGRRGWHLGPGGSLLGFVERDTGGERAVLRAAAGEGATIAHGLAGLRAVAGLGLAPRTLGEGRTAGVAWSLEEAIDGAPPSTVTPRLVDDVAARWRSLPGGTVAPEATTEDVAAVARLLPQRGDDLAAVGARVRRAGGPSTLRHGDLWAGNLLVDRNDRFVAAIDWDHWHPAAVPGTDLLQLVATERRHRARIGLGAAVLARPWLDPDLAHRLPTGVDPEVVGLAWWATEVAGTLERDPARATDGRWVADNVDAVLRVLGAGG